MDMTTLYHAIVSLLIPLGWAIILYPFYLRKSEEWKKTLLFVVVLSFMTMFVKEFIDSEFSINDVVANLLGLFFGTAIVLALFRLKQNWSSRRETDVDSLDESVDGGIEFRGGIQGDEPDDRDRISLRDLVALGVNIQEKGVSLYDGAVKGLNNPKAQELCIRLAQEKREEEDKLRRLLFRWPHKVKDADFFRKMEIEIKDREIFAMHLLEDSIESDLLNYAIQQEGKISDLFSGFKRSFEKEPWKMRQLDIFIQSINDYIGQLRMEMSKLEEESISNGLKGDNTYMNRWSEVSNILPLKERSYPYEARILIVDDEKEIRGSLKEFLKEDGFGSVDTANNGEEAIEKFNREIYDIVIVDIFMPKKHGIDVLKHVKSISPGTNVIIVTARGGQKTVKEAFRLGAFDYIEKPFKYDLFSTIIKKALEDKVFLGEKKESS